MHELGITQEIVEIACQKAGGASVRRIVVQIGRLAAVVPEAIQFCFELCAEGTAAEGAELQIIETPGLGRCRACDADVELDRPFGRCPCGSTDLEWVRGDELVVKTLELT